MTTKTKKSASASQLAKADIIFRPMLATKMSTFNDIKIVFIAPSKHGLRLIVRKGAEPTTFGIYVFPEAVALAGIKAGDIVTVLAEQREKDGEKYWNATALAKQE